MLLVRDGSIYDLGVLAHFGTENYAWKIAIIEKYLWILLIFLSDFFYLKRANTSKSYTAICFILIVLQYVLFHSLIITANLSIQTFFDTEIKYLSILFIKVPINPSATIEFPS